MPESAQVTPAEPVSFVTDAVNDCEPRFACKDFEVGETLTETTGTAVIVILAEAPFVPSALEVAVSVTAAGLGTVAGAI